MDAAGRSMHEERLVQLSVPLPCLLQGYSNLALAMQAKPVRLASISVVALLPATTFFQCATEAHLLCRGGEDVVFTFCCLRVYHGGIVGEVICRESDPCRSASIVSAADWAVTRITWLLLTHRVRVRRGCLIPSILRSTTPNVSKFSSEPVTNSCLQPYGSQPRLICTRDRLLPAIPPPI